MWLVELAPLADPAVVPAAVAAVLGVRPPPGRPLLDALAEALRPGRALPLEEVIGLALSAPAPRGSAATAAPGQALRLRPGLEDAQLTPRQREVAALVACGRTNRQIAAELVIAERTAETHVDHILTRLGFSSRAQIASWVVEQDRAAPQGAPHAPHAQKEEGEHDRGRPSLGVRGAAAGT